MNAELVKTQQMLRAIEGSDGGKVSQELRQALELFRGILNPKRNDQGASKNAAQKPQILIA
ncbi:MAG: hypothetical protein ABTQ34_06745 [Bdellovibrionales bacterium]